MTDLTSPPRAYPSRADFLIRPLLAACGLLLAVWITWLLFLRTETGQVVDDLARAGAGREGLLHTITSPLLAAVSAPAIVLAGLALVGVALVRRRYALAVGVAVLYIGSNLTTQLIKLLLDRPEYGAVTAYGNSWPSGHTTIAATVAAGALLVATARWRGAVALVGGLYVVLTGWGTVLADWHRPADVIAAIMVAGAWYALVELGRRALPSQYDVTEPARPSAGATARVLDVVGGIAAALGVGILAATALSLPDPGDLGTSSGLARWAFIGSCCGIVAVTAGVQRLLWAVGPHR